MSFNIRIFRTVYEPDFLLIKCKWIDWLCGRKLVSTTLLDFLRGDLSPTWSSNGSTALPLKPPTLLLVILFSFPPTFPNLLQRARSLHNVSKSRIIWAWSLCFKWELWIDLFNHLFVCLDVHGILRRLLQHQSSKNDNILLILLFQSPLCMFW